LRSTTSLVLTAPEPACILWGADPVLLYNDLGLPVLGSKHPASLGKYVRVALAEAWPVIGPLVEQVITTGPPVLGERRFRVVRELSLRTANAQLASSDSGMTYGA
jgi:hypothetical protein